MKEKILDDNLLEHAPKYDKKDFKFFRNFHNLADAKQFTDLLNEYNIPYLAGSTETILDEAIVGSGLLPKVVLKVLPQDFSKINLIIETEIQTSKHDFKDHYLNQLEDNELREIFVKPDEWSVEDVNIAKVLIRNRGVKITDVEIQDLRNSRLAEIRAGKEVSMFWIGVYFLGIISGLFLGVFLTIAGIGMGYYYAYGKNTDPDGQRYFVYASKTRFYGKLILYLGLAILLAGGFYLFFGTDLFTGFY